MTIEKSYRARTRGFTLVELMIVVLIAGVLLSLAYPTYMESVRKGRRADAFDALSRLQLAQERYRSNHTTYGTLAQIGFNSTSDARYYTIAVISPTASGYSATATAVSGKSQTADQADGVSCATLRVNQDSAVYSPAGQIACWRR